MIDNSLDSLRPEFQPVAHKFFHIVSDDLGIDARCLETKRTEIRQLEVRAANASSLKFGWHNVGLALDYAIYVDGIWQKDDSSGLYLRCGYVAMALDCRWGGNWDRDATVKERNESDFGHIEYHPGFTLQQFLGGQKGGVIA